MRQHSNSQPNTAERFIAAASYLSAGLIGFIWLILGIWLKSTIRPFLKYHIFQSIFLSIAFYLFSQLIGLVVNIISIIPFLGGLMMRLTFYLNMPLVGTLSLIQTIVYAVLLYLVWTSLQGKFSYIPWISEIITANVRNS